MDYIGSVAKDADAFARAQLPDVAREIVAWELWSGVFLLVPAVVAVWLATFFYRKGMAVVKKNSRDADPFAWFLIATILACVGAAGTVTSGTSVVKATVAPRLVILDYVKGVMK
jgi:hypothetical protein